MVLRIELPPDVEARYAAEASAMGVPIEVHLRERLIEVASCAQPGAAADSPAAHTLNLPVMKGGVIGSLRREDIYDEWLDKRYHG